VFFEVVEGADPALLDELVIAGELPSDFLAGTFRSEVVLLVGQCFSNVFTLHHISALEFDGKVR
jgi:hypothetical protein